MLHQLDHVHVGDALVAVDCCHLVDDRLQLLWGQLLLLEHLVHEQTQVDLILLLYDLLHTLDATLEDGLGGFVG